MQLIIEMLGYYKCTSHHLTRLGTEMQARAPNPIGSPKENELQTTKNTLPITNFR